MSIMAAINRLLGRQPRMTEEERLARATERAVVQRRLNQQEIAVQMLDAQVEVARLARKRQ